MAVLGNVINKQIYIEKALNELENFSSERIQTLVEQVGECTKDTKCPLYPFYERSVRSDGSINVEVKQFERKDGKTLLNIIVSRFLSYMNEEIQQILNAKEDLLSICEILKSIENDSSEAEKDKLLANFDSNFSYLLNIDVFKEVYIEFRKDYIKLLEKGLRISYSQKTHREELKNHAFFSPNSAAVSKNYRSKGLNFLSKNKPIRNEFHS